MIRHGSPAPMPGRRGGRSRPWPRLVEGKRKWRKGRKGRNWTNWTSWRSWRSWEGFEGLEGLGGAARDDAALERTTNDRSQPAERHRSLNTKEQRCRHHPDIAISTCTHRPVRNKLRRRLAPTVASKDPDLRLLPTFPGGPTCSIRAGHSQVPCRDDWPGRASVLHNVMDLMFGGKVAMQPAFLASLPPSRRYRTPRLEVTLSRACHSLPW